MIEKESTGLVTSLLLLMRLVYMLYWYDAGNMLNVLSSLKCLDGIYYVSFISVFINFSFLPRLN